MSGPTDRVPTAAAISISRCDHGMIHIHLLDANGVAFAVAGFTAESAVQVAHDIESSAGLAAQVEQRERVH